MERRAEPKSRSLTAVRKERDRVRDDNLDARGWLARMSTEPDDF